MKSNVQLQMYLGNSNKPKRKSIVNVMSKSPGLPEWGAGGRGSEPPLASEGLAGQGRHSRPQ